VLRNDELTGAARPCFRRRAGPPRRGHNATLAVQNLNSGILHATGPLSGDLNSLFCAVSPSYNYNGLAIRKHHRRRGR
jgi:hypothetical protein